MTIGGGLGAMVAFILTAVFPVDPAVGFGALFGYFAIFGVTAGVLIGASIALLLDRRSFTRAVGARAERASSAPDAGGPGPRAADDDTDTDTDRPASDS